MLLCAEHSNSCQIHPSGVRKARLRNFTSPTLVYTRHPVERLFRMKPEDPELPSTAQANSALWDYDILQDDAMVPITTLAEAVGLSSTPCWRRVRKLEDEGYIRQRVALVDRRKVNVPMTIFVRVKAPRHEAEWLARFRALISEFPEIVEAHEKALEQTTSWFKKTLVVA